MSRTLVALLLWLGTAALVVTTFVGQGDPCTPAAWSFWTWQAVGVAAAGAMFASLRWRLIFSVPVAVVVGGVVWAGLGFLLVASWVGACTA